MLDVLMLLQNDWSNTGFRYLKALKHLGLRVIALKGQYHPFMYPEQIPVHPAITAAGDPSKLAYHIPVLHDIASQAKVLHFTCSTYIHTDIDTDKTKIVMQHGGTSYRKNYKELNKIYNQFVNKTIIQTSDLLGLGADNEEWIPLMVDTEFIQPVFRPAKPVKLVVGHFARGSEKGTEAINRAVYELCKEDKAVRDRIEFRTEKTHTGGFKIWYDHLDRLAECDVVIETLAPTAHGGCDFGSWGNTPLEVAALGKIAVTNDHRRTLYEATFGPTPLHTPNTPEDLKNTLRMLAGLSDDEILKEKQEFRAWVEDVHDVHVVAKRLWSKVYKPLLEEV